MEGPFGFPRMTSTGPLVKGECTLSAVQGRKISSISEDIVEEFSDPPNKLPDKYIKQIEDVCDCEYIADGSTRAVFRLSDKCVLKVSKLFKPYSNISEIVGTRDKLTKEEANMFLPVIDYDTDDKRWLTMPHADPTISGKEYVETVKTIILDFGIDLVDPHIENFGKIEGNIVCFDYGSGITFVEQSPEWDSKEELWEFERERLEEEWKVDLS